MPLIVVPAVITLAITLLRLAGELLNWSPVLFSRAAGGGFSLVGISWLVPIFGIYFALKLAGRGDGPASGWKAAGFGFLAIVLHTACVALLAWLKLPFVAVLSVIAVASWVAIAIAFPGWPSLARTLLGYGLAARIPVAIVMLVAIYLNWGTHYDVAPPDQPAVNTLAPIVKWFWIGLVPQMTVWLYVTVAAGMLFGGITAALAGGRKTP